MPKGSCASLYQVLIYTNEKTIGKKAGNRQLKFELFLSMWQFLLNMHFKVDRSRRTREHINMEKIVQMTHP